MVRVRFAPSPTGLLHIGNTRTALFNWLFARHNNGAFILRIDDTDAARSCPKFTHAIETDLKWLGLTWDERYVQSERTCLYQEAITYLKQQGKLYPCYESPLELEEKRKIAIASGRPPIYDRASLGTLPNSSDRPAHWRFLLEEKEVKWQDGIQKEMAYHTQHLSDPIVIREDGSISYLLSSVIDDHTMHITHVIRGSDHLTNTAIQIQMLQALQEKPINWSHFPLMMNAEGQKFSKRTNSVTIQDMNSHGLFPLAILKSLARFGCQHSYDGDLYAMADQFELCTYSKSSSQFDMGLIEQEQRNVIHNLSFHDACSLAPEQPLSDDVWSCIRPNIHTLQDIPYWNAVCRDVKWLSSWRLDRSFSDIALGALPEMPWHGQSWDQWITALLLKDQSLKKSTVCPLLRRVLTGQKNGPKMQDIFPLIAPECVKARLSKWDDV